MRISNGHVVGYPFICMDLYEENSNIVKRD